MGRGFNTLISKQDSQKNVVFLTFVPDDPQILEPFATAPLPPKAAPGDSNPCRQGQNITPE